MHGLRGQLWRFFLVGGSNTLMTMALMALLSQFMQPALAYTLVFAVGVVYACTLTSRYVFTARASRARVTVFGTWYVVVYLIGLMVVRLLEINDVGNLGIAVITICVTAPLSFLGGRFLFHRPSRPAGVASLQGHVQ